MLASLLLALAASNPAHAGATEIWSYDSWPNGGSVAGTGGWQNGWGGDPWYGGDLYGWGVTPVWSSSDSNTSDDSGAIDNWLVNEAVPVTQGAWAAGFYSEDDDSFGLVIGNEGSGNYYLFAFCGADGGGSPNCPFDLSSDVGSALIQMSGGRATILAESSTTYEPNDYGPIYISYNDGVLSGHWDDVGLELSAAVSGIPDLSRVGFWSYDAGYDGGRYNTNTCFYQNALYAWDDDDDGVVDDDDNCEKAANADQADNDRDGLGNVCDSTPDGAGGGTGGGGTDTGGGNTDTGNGGGGTDTGNGGGGTDTDTGNGGGTDSGGSTDSAVTDDTAGVDGVGDDALSAEEAAKLTYQGNCGCATPATAPSSGGLLAVGAALVGFLARRRK